MATHTVGGHPINPAYTTPSNGSALDADVVKNNFNNTRSFYNAHDADATVHVQSSTLAARDTVGTDGRVWLSTTTLGSAAYYILAFDNGSTWLRDTTFPTTNGQADVFDAGSSSTSKTIDWANGPVQKVNMTGNCTFSFTNHSSGGTYTLIMVQTSGGNTATLTGWNFGDNTPSFNTAAGKINVVSGVYYLTQYLAAFAVKGA